MPDIVLHWRFITLENAQIIARQRHLETWLQHNKIKIIRKAFNKEVEVNDTHTYLGKDTEKNKTLTGAITFMGERIQHAERNSPAGIVYVGILCRTNNICKRM